MVIFRKFFLLFNKTLKIKYMTKGKYSKYKILNNKNTAT